MNYKIIGILGPLFYKLSIVYTIIYYSLLLFVKFSIVGETIFNEILFALGVLFMGLHVTILIGLLFLFTTTLIAVNIGKNFIKDEAQKIKTTLLLKTIKYRMLIPMLYAFLPVLMYTYYITKITILVPFAYYPLWFIFIYKYIEKKIKNYEIEIESPFTDYQDIRMY